MRRPGGAARRCGYGEIELRAALERKICESHRVPGVQIVLQGSYGTLKTVASALSNDCQARPPSAH